jgi:stage II sporulation protein P
MKRKRIYRRRKRSAGPSACGWVLLALCWLCVLPIAAFVFRPKEAGAAEQRTAGTDATPTPEATEAFLPMRQELPELTASMTVLPPVNPLRSDKPTVLIYHTHTTEAYTQTPEDTYAETSKWRTSDNTKNVVAVGEALKEILELQYGFQVIHDTTDHEPPKLSTAYDRSLQTMEKYHRDYPSIVLFIDLHRDAYETDEAPCDYLTIHGVETARLMLVVGKGEKYTDKPYYAWNKALADRMTAHLNSIDAKLCRPVRVKTGRYNQHVAPNCILVEVGHNANTLAQAKAAMPYLAESIAYAFSSGRIAPSDWTPN